MQVSLEEKQQELLAKSKEKYEKDKAEMAHLLKVRNDIRKDELMDAVVKSDKSYDKSLAYISGEK